MSDFKWWAFYLFSLFFTCFCSTPLSHAATFKLNAYTLIACITNVYNP